MSPHPKPLSAGVVVVHDSTAGTRFLLLRAFRHWDFPKGMVEPEEMPIAAARREVTEETGITDLDFAWGERYFETGPYGRGKVARYYVARSATLEATLPVNPVLGRPEHNEFRWMDRAQALDVATPRVREVILWACAVMENSTATP